MSKNTRQKWAERVREWRDSGLTAEEFTEGKDYGASSLRSAESKLKDQEAPKKQRRRRSAEKAPVKTTSTAPRFLAVRTGTSPSVGPDVVVEVGGARIRVSRGADLAFIGDVVRALQGGGR
jgi:transposase